VSLNHGGGQDRDATRKRVVWENASAADGPTRHLRVARPRGRAGGRGTARQRGGPAPGGPDGHHRPRDRAPDRARRDPLPENVRSLDDAHVQALAGSIALQGMLVPLVVRGDGDGFELVAGFHRIAAARSVGLADVPARHAPRAARGLQLRRRGASCRTRTASPAGGLTAARVRRGWSAASRKPEMRAAGPCSAGGYTGLRMDPLFASLVRPSVRLARWPRSHRVQYHGSMGDSHAGVTAAGAS
jgi:hypothetical protein